MAFVPRSVDIYEEEGWHLGPFTEGELKHNVTHSRLQCLDGNLGRSSLELEMGGAGEGSTAQQF